MVLVILGFLGWQGFQHLRPRAQLPSAPLERASSTAPAAAAAPPPAASFTCDGRIYCSQMTSCAEATFFLRNCPGVKMDGNNDGVPCEQQWCRR